jgi:protein TonB
VLSSLHKLKQDCSLDQESPVEASLLAKEPRQQAGFHDRKSSNGQSRFKKEQLIGLLFVLVLHGAGLYGLWSYHIIPAPDEAVTLMVNFIKPPAPESPKPEQPKSRPLEPPPEEHHHLVAEAPVVSPDEPVAYAPPPEPVVAAVPPPQMMLPAQPVMLTSELSVICTDRAVPNYPLVSKRMNEQGKLVLRVELGEDGKVSNATVKTSSGFSRLDEAALTAVKTWRCKPPVRDALAVRAVALQAFNFSLSE